MLELLELADKGNSSHKRRHYLKMKGIKAVFPFKLNEKASREGRRKLDTHRYKRHNIIEHYFRMLKEHHRIATGSQQIAKITLLGLN